MRILILNYEYPPLGGGAGIVTRHLAERFAAAGHSVYVVTTWFPGESEFSVEGNLSIMRLPSLRKKTYRSNPLEMYSWMRHALRYFKDLPVAPQIDICLANFTMPGGYVARYLKHTWNIPYVILSHGHDLPWFAPKQMFFWHLLCYPIIRRVTASSAYNILLTKELKYLADKFTGEKWVSKNLVIPNGILIDHCRVGFSTPREPLQVLFVGRMVEQKDPITFVKACKLIQDMNIRAHFTMIGDGPLKKAVEDLILKLNVKNIEIRGKVSHYSVLKTYESAHVLVLPSREEAMSLVVLESVSRGLYTITTPVSGNNDVIQPGVNGEFITYGDAEGIARSVADFYKEKYLRNYQYPADFVHQLYNMYSWDRVVDQYLRLFQEITAKSSGRVG